MYINLAKRFPKMLPHAFFIIKYIYSKFILVDLTLTILDIRQLIYQKIVKC